MCFWERFTRRLAIRLGQELINPHSLSIWTLYISFSLDPCELGIGEFPRYKSGYGTFIRCCWYLTPMEAKICSGWKMRHGDPSRSKPSQTEEAASFKPRRRRRASSGWLEAERWACRCALDPLSTRFVYVQTSHSRCVSTENKRLWSTTQESCSFYTTGLAVLHLPGCSCIQHG